MEKFSWSGWKLGKDKALSLMKLLKAWQNQGLKNKRKRIEKRLRHLYRSASKLAICSWPPPPVPPLHGSSKKSIQELCRICWKRPPRQHSLLLVKAKIKQSLLQCGNIKCGPGESIAQELLKRKPVKRRAQEERMSMSSLNVLPIINVRTKLARNAIKFES